MIGTIHKALLNRDHQAVIDRLIYEIEFDLRMNSKFENNGHKFLITSDLEDTVTRNGNSVSVHKKELNKGDATNPFYITTRPLISANSSESKVTNIVKSFTSYLDNMYDEHVAQALMQDKELRLFCARTRVTNSRPPADPGEPSRIIDVDLEISLSMQAFIFLWSF